MINIDTLVPALMAQLRTDEGYSSRLYRCTSGKLTFGYGWNVEDCPIRKSEAETRLNNDVHEAIGQCAIRWPWFQELSEPRQMVIANMCFNMGMPHLRQFVRMIAAIERKDWAAAKAEMLDSDWAKQVGDRAKRLADIMETGA